MPGPYRLYGADLSPYSIKVRNYLRFKGIEHTWIARSAARQAEFARFARLPLIPVLVGSDDFALQDSTPIIEKLEVQNPDPTIRLDDEAAGFFAALLEDYADEWVNKAMFHYRWTYPDNQQSAAERLVAMIYDGQTAPDGAVDAIRERMTGRLHHVGSNAETAPIIEQSFERLIGLLETHLSGRAYLFGGRPSIADFGLAAQLGQLLSDPTPGAILTARAPNTVAWIKRMDDAQVSGPFEPFSDLWPTLKPLIVAEVVGVYLPWSSANHAVSRADGDEVRVELPGGVMVQKPQKYAAKALHDVRRKRVALSENEALKAMLAETGCEPFLVIPMLDRTQDASDDQASPAHDGRSEDNDGERVEDGAEQA